MNEYFDRYQYNAALANKAEAQLPDDLGWSCVIRFYAALHLMNAYLVKKGNVRFDPGAAAHPERRQAMQKCPELRDAPGKYRELKDLSEAVRYDVGFKYLPSHHQASKSLLAKIVAIVEPKVKK